MLLRCAKVLFTL